MSTQNNEVIQKAKTNVVKVETSNVSGSDSSILPTKKYNGLDNVFISD
jgi:hypothetical protein